MISTHSLGRMSPPLLTRQRNIPINYQEDETDDEGESMDEDDSEEREEVTSDAEPEELVDTIEKVMDIRQGKKGGEPFQLRFGRERMCDREGQNMVSSGFISFIIFQKLVSHLI